jgi:putative membrane protein
MSFIRKLLIILLVLATIAAGVLFALQNKAPVPLDLLVYAFPPRSVSLWVLCAFGLGGLLGMVASSGMMLRLRTSLRSANRQLKRARLELDKLQNPSPADSE